MRQSPHEWTREISSGYDHIVTRSVLRAGRIASVRVSGPVSRLLLCSDGVSKVLSFEVITASLSAPESPRRAALALLTATRSQRRARDSVALSVLARASQCGQACYRYRPVGTVRTRRRRRRRGTSWRVARRVAGRL